MKKIIFLIFVCCLFLVSCISQSNEKLIWSSIHNDLDEDIIETLDNKGYKKKSIQFDNTNNVDGLWERYSWILLNDDILLINVDDIPDKKKGYNYLIAYSKKMEGVVFVSKPYYDYHMDVIDVSEKKENILVDLKLIMVGDYDPEYVTISIRNSN